MSTVSANLLKKAVNSPADSDSLKCVVSIPQKNSEKASLFDLYEFSQRKTTKLMPLPDIIR